MADNPYPGILDRILGAPWPEPDPVPAAMSPFLGGFPDARAITGGNYLAIPLSSGPASTPGVNQWQAGPPPMMVNNQPWPGATAILSGGAGSAPPAPSAALLGGTGNPQSALTPDVNQWQAGPPDTVVAGPTAQDLANSVNGILAGTPMQGLGDSFVANGQKWNLDPRVMAAFASPESSFGANIKPGSFNPFGLMQNGEIINYPSWDAAINGLGKSLNNDANKNNLTDTHAAYLGRYCQSGNANRGLIRSTSV